MVILMLAAMPVQAEQVRCLEAPYIAATTPEQERLAELYADIAPALARLPELDVAQSPNAPALCFADTLDGAEGYYDAEGSRIVLRSGLSRALLAGILLHELRHLDQFTRGYCPSNDVSMQENAKAVFAMEADASAVSLMAAWMLGESGHPAIWDALANWQSQRDIADRFAAEMHQGGDMLAALKGAFDQWYSSEERTESYYLMSCADYLDRQDESKLLPNYRLLPENFFEDLCSLSGDLDYTCTEPVAPD